MKKTVISILLTAAFTASTFAQDIATVNGKPIPQARERVLLEQIQRSNPGSEIDANMLKDNLITQEVLSQEAVKLGLDKTENYHQQVEMTNRALLVSALYEHYLAKNPVTDQTIAAEYERMKTLTSTEYQSRHILVATKEEAQNLINQLNHGAKFSELASKFSLDKGTANAGGLLDWSPESVYVDEFAQALYNLEKGQLTSEPVQSQYGWHIIKLEDIRTNDTNSFPPLEDGIKEQLRSQLEQKGFLEYQQKLIEQADIQKGQ